MLPTDITGVNVFNQERGDFEFRPGAVFANVVLGDEINRASPKTQSALLECMEERQVTIDAETHTLGTPFMVIATQNPVEHEGTYPLPEAQLDRFMMRLSIGYPSLQIEAEILETHSAGQPLGVISAVTDAQGIAEMIEQARRVHVAPTIRDYIVQIVHTTRFPAESGLKDLAPLIEYGASPRATLALAQASRAHAFLRGRAFVTPEDVKAIAPDVLRHRVLTTYEAEAEEVTSDAIVARVLDTVAAP